MEKFGFENLPADKKDPDIGHKEYPKTSGVQEKPFQKSIFEEREKEAREILEKGNFFGRQEVEKALGIEVDPLIIPEIPFPKKDLEKAKELGQFLILRVDKTKDGDPLTMEKINHLQKGKDYEGKKLLHLNDKEGETLKSAWYKKKYFFKKETPELSWALVSKDIIPRSGGKDYLKQTEEIIYYIKDIFKDGEIPEEYQEAIEEFEDKKDGLKKMLVHDWEGVLEKARHPGETLAPDMFEAVEKLSDLKINQLTRPTPVEVFYDSVVYYQGAGQPLYEKEFVWTSAKSFHDYKESKRANMSKHLRVSSGTIGGRDGIILLGRPASLGIRIHSYKPDASLGFLGASFSRKR